MHSPQGHFFVYILGNQLKSDLSIGVSANLQQHIQSGAEPVDKPKLVYYEHYDLEELARVREQQIKSGSLEEASRLVESMNPNWLDLADTLS
ncbi:excinuclease ABC subunit C [Pontibacter sp. JH31]|uniref:Excinuclease ABC subunit C n=1 Tax=Pontibacter aquaedesilientis TaxID=2766980 RepID=A0ABR7XCU0_9BACT|nr:excinuclease ABC subunit C [Pontibacter aquaedesilientis]MBD1396111.1 excinuclease ABC subunit C [Pontibacter aquaedesilientis]